MEDKIVTLKVKHNLDDVAKKVDDVNDKLDETNEKVDDIGDSAKKAESGISKLGKAFTGLGLAIKAAGIGLLLEAFQVFKDTISANQKVIDLFNTSMTATKMIFSDIVKLISGDLSFKKFVDNLGKSWTKATDTTQLENNAKRAVIIQQGLIEKYDRLAELQRQIRDNDALSMPTRMKANERLGEILKKQNAEMQKQAKYQVEAAQVRYKMMPNLENELALMEARNNQTAIAAQVTGLESEQLVNRNSLLTEAKAKKEELIQKTNEERLAEIAKLDAKLAAIRTYEANIAAEEIAAEEERKLRAAEKQKQIEFENNAELDSYATYMANITTEEEKNKEASKKIADEKRRAQTEALMAIAQSFADAGAIIGQETAAGKALSIASATISTFVAAQAAYENAQKIPIVGSVLAPINAGLAIAAGLKNVQRIVDVEVPGGGGGGMPSMGSQFGGGMAPRFNVVGQSTANQVAQAVGQNIAPVKAYVVSSDVTTAQALDRNKISSATLG